LPEKEICLFYIKNQNIKKTAEYFGHDQETISKILYKNNIQVKTTQEINKEIRSLAVAKINLITNEIIEIYPSTSEAEKKNKCHTHIKDVCHGKRKSAGGYGWKYI